MVKRNFFVEIGRVCVVNYGPNAGKVCVILDVVDQSRALVDGPAHITGMARQTFPLRQLSLTSIKMTIPRSIKTGTLTKLFVKEDVMGQYKKTSWAKKAAAKAK